MKKYTSVLMMCARQSVYKLFVVLVAMVVGEGIWFYSKMTDEPDSLNRIYQSLDLYAICFLVWWAFTVILGIYGCRVKGDSPSLFLRLQVSKGKIFWLQTLYNCMAYMMLLSVQFVLIFLMGISFGLNFPEKTGPQTIFLAMIEETYIYEPCVIDMVSPFLGGLMWGLRIVCIGIFAMTTAGITTRVLD